MRHETRVSCLSIHLYGQDWCSELPIVWTHGRAPTLHSVRHRAHGGALRSGFPQHPPGRPPDTFPVVRAAFGLARTSLPAAPWGNFLARDNAAWHVRVPTVVSAWLPAAANIFTHVLDMPASPIGCLCAHMATRLSPNAALSLRICSPAVYSTPLPALQVLLPMRHMCKELVQAYTEHTNGKDLSGVGRQWQADELAELPRSIS